MLINLFPSLNSQNEKISPATNQESHTERVGGGGRGLGKSNIKKYWGFGTRDQRGELEQTLVMLILYPGFKDVVT